MRPVLLLWLFAACTFPAPGMNEPCILVRAGPDGGAEKIPASDPIVAYATNRDILSFGATECPTKICVRDTSFVDAPGATFAGGYCSGACGACASQKRELDQSPATKLSCRALLLDEETLAALKKADPDRYQKIFGEATMPNFCARTPIQP